ncbi:type VII secretion integral membrane protein EccD [Actinomadura darangshiensis]|uniref:type VII secretion integral membrane protein EccD n=1 Tax=Actinomadura darangshiensis TaxID=705336 RepID=UPI001FB61129|nr:type VII secretion integral membrane protein EccD [Actinomadura darangshiensis]
MTVVGETRRVDMVLPAHAPLGVMMPDVLELLGDPVLSPPRLRHLVTSTGEVLDPAASLADRRVPDGAVLRLLHADEPLPAPVVHEMPEVVGDATAGRPWSWNPAAARWTATAAFTALLFAASLVARAVLPAGAGHWVLSAAALPALLGGVVASGGRREPLGIAITFGGGAIAMPAVWAAADAWGWPVWVRWGGVVLVAAVLLALLGLTSPLGRGGLIGGGTMAVFGATAAVCGTLGLDTPRTAAVLTLGCVVLLSTVLRLALSLSGLASLDDRRSAGDPVLRGDVMRALDGAHRSMSIAIGSIAVAAAVAGLGALSRFDGYTAALAGLLALVVAGRARVFPLVAEKVALLAAAVTVVIGLAVRCAGEFAWGAAPALGLLGAALVVPAVVLAGERPEHVRARLRQAMNRVETVALVAIIPVVLGTFGTFERLLGTF